MRKDKSRPWLHGVEHVTKDERGNVYWRGRRIDHYSPTTPEKELQAVNDLSISCLRLEELRQEVNTMNLFALWDRVRWAIDVQGSPKWAVFFDASKEERWIKSLYLGTGEGSSVAELQRAASATAQEFESQGRPGVRTSIVSTKEGFDLAISFIESHFKWARQVYFNHSPDVRREEDWTLGQLRTMINANDLPSNADARNATMGTSTPAEPCRDTQSML
jgi:hypothetical protein